MLHFFLYFQSVSYYYIVYFISMLLYAFVSILCQSLVSIFSYPSLINLPLLFAQVSLSFLFVWLCLTSLLIRPTCFFFFVYTLIGIPGHLRQLLYK